MIYLHILLFVTPVHRIRRLLQLRFWSRESQISMSLAASAAPVPEPPIVDVWNENLDEAFDNIMRIIDTHTVVGMVCFLSSYHMTHEPPL